MTARSRAVDAPTTATSGVRPSAGDAEQAHQRAYLLIISDRTLAQEVAFIAHDRGVEVHVALTGEAGVDRTRERTFSAILLQGLLPDTDAIRWLNEASVRTRATPMVVMSSFRGILDTARTSFDVAGTVDEPTDAETLFTALVNAEQGRRPETEPSPRARLDEAARTYAATLPGKLRVIAEAWPTQPESAEKLAHRLRGTAGCYGFDEVGEVAGTLEEALSSRAQPAVQAALDAVEHAIERAVERARQS